jgi:hypothetical protein
MISIRQHLKHLVEDILGRHLTAAIDELAAALEDEIEMRAQDRIADLRQQFEQGHD